jgi:hypothetical protein
MVGTRFPSKVCGTAAEIDRVTVGSRETTDKLQREQIGPPGK